MNGLKLPAGGQKSSFAMGGKARSLPVLLERPWVLALFTGVVRDSDLLAFI